MRHTSEYSVAGLDSEVNLRPVRVGTATTGSTGFFMPKGLSVIDAKNLLMLARCNEKAYTVSRLSPSGATTLNNPWGLAESRSPGAYGNQSVASRCVETHPNISLPLLPLLGKGGF